MEREIIKGNILIDVFMGKSIEGEVTIGSVYSDYLNYHRSWDALKPVIDKIVEYALAYPEQVEKIRKLSIIVNIEPAFKAVVECIKVLQCSNLNQHPHKEQF